MRLPLNDEATSHLAIMKLAQILDFISHHDYFCIIAPKIDDWEKNTLRLAAVFNFEKMKPINGKFILKVVKKEDVRIIVNEEKGMTTKCLPIVVKDITGEKNQISLWPNHIKFEKIQEGKTYFFENIGTLIVTNGELVSGL